MHHTQKGESLKDLVMILMGTSFTIITDGETRFGFELNSQTLTTYHPRADRVVKHFHRR